MSGLVELERTLALIKPDAIGSMEEIIRLIKNSGFSILGQRRVSLSPEQVSDFYSEHYGKVSKLEFLNTKSFRFQMFFTNLVSFMSSGPIVALVLAKEGAIASWRQVMGPTNPQDARESFPDTVRALFGKGT